MKKLPLTLFLILLILIFGSIVSNAQQAEKSEVKKSWFSKFTDFLKSLFTRQKMEPAQVNQSNQSSQEEKENISEVVLPVTNLTKKYVEWFNKTKSSLHLENPAVKCISDGTCNGSYELYFKVNYSLSEEAVKNLFKRYGNVTRIEPRPNDGEYRVRLELKTPQIVNEFIDFPFVRDLYITSVSSDYGYDISEEELASCKVDEDCIDFDSACCSCGLKAVNRIYVQMLEDKKQVGCMGTFCTSVGSGGFGLNCLSTDAIKCVNRSCMFLPGDQAPCNTRIYALCRDEVPKSEWNLNRIHNINCDESIRLCEGNMSKEEIYKLCMKRTVVPAKYQPGQVFVTFDSNNESEMKEFVKNARLNHTTMLHSSTYLVRKLFDPIGYAEANGLDWWRDRDEIVLNLTEQGLAPVEYFNSFPQYVMNVKSNHNDAGSVVWITFYGNVSLNLSKQIIMNYSNIREFEPVEFWGFTKTDIITVPEGKEKEFICKLKEENIIHKAYFNSTS